jgi:hypothetical protein
MMLLIYSFLRLGNTGKKMSSFTQRLLYYSGNEPPGTHRVRDWVGSRQDLGCFEAKSALSNKVQADRHEVGNLSRRSFA